MPGRQLPRRITWIDAWVKGLWKCHGYWSWVVLFHVKCVTPRDINNFYNSEKKIQKHHKLDNCHFLGRSGRAYMLRLVWIDRVKWPSMRRSATLWDKKMFLYWVQLVSMYIWTFYSAIKTSMIHRLLKLNILTAVSVLHNILKMKIFSMH